ncbi:hypothetical protein CJP74_07820 [Psittacicella melopsittaci]|uniref:Type I restriction modification DNA specificity domain-containing protein n=1 Tax=Psittacicella melopsittaci TaxID=2028576 RepID=A0A3A1XZ14_9GAMM|nr:restriction endonuclease subunit S [Psittacicella melopsittaci]RIY31223.1 hypothetical protein CJP74_07820 [Psittacicella melopsittaci]
MFADKAIAKTLSKFKHTATAENANSKLEELRFSIAKYTAEQTVRDFYLEANFELVYQDKLLTFEKSIRYLSEEKPKNNLPKLRFPGFNESYQFFEVNEIGKVQTGNTPSTKVKEYWSREDDQRKHKWVTPSDINSPTIENTKRTLTDLGWEKARKVPANSLLITCIASIGKNTINTVPTSFNQQINSLTAKKGFDVYYLLTSFNKNTKKLIRAGASSITNIVNKTQFESFTLRLPKDYKEQQKIGKFFKEVDDKITSLQNALSKSKELKRTLIYKLLFVQNNSQPDLRFSGFNKYWKKGELYSIFDYFKIGKIDNISRLSQEKTEEFRYPVYSSKTSNNGICGYFDTYSFENSITWTTDGEYAGDVKYREGKFQASIHCGIMISNRGFSCVSIAEILNRIAYRYATRANIPRVGMGTLKQIVISYPQGTEELQKLNCLFTDINNLIYTYEATLKQHKKFKQALVQRMLV